MIPKILFSIYIIFLIAQPQLSMIPQWYLDKVMRAAYPVKPWLQKQLEGPSRSYQEHITNHAYLSTLAVWALRLNLKFGIGLIIISLAYPFFKEFYWDPIHKGKPFSNTDWRQRLLGALIPLPLIGYYFLR